MLEGKFEVVVLDHWATDIENRFSYLSSTGIKVVGGFPPNAVVQRYQKPFTQYDLVFIHFPRCGERVHYVPVWVKELVSRRKSNIYFISHNQTIDRTQVFPEFESREFFILGLGDPSEINLKLAGFIKEKRDEIEKQGEQKC